MYTFKSEDHTIWGKPIYIHICICTYNAKIHGIPVIAGM